VKEWYIFIPFIKLFIKVTKLSVAKIQLEVIVHVSWYVISSDHRAAYLYI